VRCPIC